MLYRFIVLISGVDPSEMSGDKSGVFINFTPKTKKPEPATRPLQVNFDLDLGDRGVCKPTQDGPWVFSRVAWT
jgi:hypothetical protein